MIRLEGSSSSIADISCNDTNVEVEISDDVTSTINKSSNCDGSGGSSDESGDINYAMIHTKLENAPVTYATVGGLQFRYNSTENGGYLEARSLSYSFSPNMQIYATSKQTSSSTGETTSSQNYQSSGNCCGTEWSPLIQLWENEGWDGRVKIEGYEPFEGIMHTMGGGDAPPQPPKSYRFFANIDGYNQLFLKVEYFGP